MIMPKTKAAKTSTILTKSIPSVSMFFKETWSLYKKVAVPFIFLSLIQIVIAIVVISGLGLGGVLIGLALGPGGSFSFLQNSGQMNADQMTPFISSIAASVGIFSLVVLVAIINLGSAFQASLIILTAKKGKVGVGEALNHGFKYIVPVLIVSAIMSFLVFGGLFLFLIPGIVMGILMSFAAFEVVLEDRKPLAAIKASISMVSQNFWSVVGRILLIWLATMLLYIVLSIVTSIFSEATASLIVMAFNIALTPLSLVSLTVLYQHTKSASVEKPVSMVWMWIVAVIGAMIGLSLMILIAGFAVKNFGVLDSVYPSELKSLTIDISENAFKTVNEHRRANNLMPLVENIELCISPTGDIKDVMNSENMYNHHYSEATTSKFA